MMMLNNIQALMCAICITLMASCSTSQRGVFVKKTPHEKYESKLKEAGLANTQLGQLWMQAANKSLTTPISINLPYKETGYFEMNMPGASGYVFSAKRGEKVNIQVTTNPQIGFLLFTELWQRRSTNEKPTLLSATDTTTLRIDHEIKDDGEYIVRIQPELLQGAGYTITIITSPSLAFPVNKQEKPRVISYWGASRDAGARNHEGIDIQARKGTPTVASADGHIARVTENNLGGKVVFLRPRGKNYSLYYAHLDEQLVSQGQSVQTGDTLGLIGNTGNARNTPAHLHFGIYTPGGAVDPFPYVNDNRPKAKEVQSDTSYITKYGRVKANVVMTSGPQPNDPKVANLLSGNSIKILAATGNLYRIQLPDSSEGFVGRESVTLLPLQKKSISSSITLLDKPDAHAAIKVVIQQGSSVSLLGSYKNYYFASFDNKFGWVSKSIR